MKYSMKKEEKTFDLGDLWGDIYYYHKKLYGNIGIKEGVDFGIDGVMILSSNENWEECIFSCVFDPSIYKSIDDVIKTITREYKKSKLTNK